MMRAAAIRLLSWIVGRCLHPQWHSGVNFSGVRYGGCPDCGLLLDRSYASWAKWTPWGAGE